MNRRKVLVASVSVLAFIGLVAVSIPFINSMKPSASAGETLPHIDISKLKDGEYLVHKNSIKGYYESQYLILRDYSSMIHIFIVPVRKKQVMLPDIRWWRWGGLCSNFGPDIEKGLIKKGGLIQCQDDNLPEWWSTEWRWKYNGKNIGKYTDDMETPKYKIEGRYIVIGKT